MPQIRGMRSSPDMKPWLSIGLAAFAGTLTWKCRCLPEAQPTSDWMPRNLPVCTVSPTSRPASTPTEFLRMCEYLVHSPLACSIQT